MKKVLSLILCIVFITTLLPYADAANPYYGEYGDFYGYGTGGPIPPRTNDELTWTFSEDGKTLTISGTDEMIRPRFGEIPKTTVEKIIIEEGVKTIGRDIFSNCTALTEVSIPSTVESIKDGAFENCDAFVKVIIPSTVKYIGVDAFAGNAESRDVYIDDLSAWCKIDFGGGTVYATAANPMHNGGNLYLKGELVTDLVIPNDITIVESHVFSGCKSITSITMNINVTKIFAAFQNCTSLAKVTIPNSVTYIGHSFGGCVSIPEITIPESVEKVFGGFENCTSLEKVYFKGNKLDFIDNHTFAGCTNLKEVHIEDLAAFCKINYNVDATGLAGSPLYNGAKLFLNGELVENLIIPSNVTSIAHYAFAGCSSIISVEIPSNVTSIGEEAFLHCESLVEITLPDKQIAISKDAFKDTGYYNDEENWEDSILYIGTYLINTKKDITVANIKEGTQYISDAAFEECDALERVEFPDTIKRLGKKAFYDCDALKSITIPNLVTTIESDSFDFCNSLEEVIFPSSLTNIGAYSFQFCSSLKSVYIPSSVTTIGEYAFTDSPRPTLIGNAGSAAERHAKAYDFPFVQVGGGNNSENNTNNNTRPVVSNGGGGDSKPKKPVVGLANFKTVKTYDKTFTDVESDAWYAGSIKIAYELDLVNGKGGDKYDPAGNISIAEAITLVTRIHSIYKTGKGFFDPWIPWYEVYVDYAIVNDIIAEDRFTDFNAPVTREEFAEIFAKAVPEDDLNAINNIEKGSIPDVAESDAVYLLYNAGVLTGSDEAHSFKPESNIQRSEVATIVTRIVDKEKRITFEIE